jgi:tetratricopeptide (TPR) repeat protein
MLNKINISYSKQKLIVCIVLILATLAVYWQVNQYDFVDSEDNDYVTANIHIQSGITLEEIRWAFSTTYHRYWHPLTWLSLMLDYQLHGLNAGGYHVTNLIVHILSTLLLFWLFNRMTGEIRKSAFVAALFALHPMHVESVARIASRKDVLNAFFWMLTLCLYVYYTEKPVIRRYLLVLFSFVLALMSKPMVVTLPLIMILLDYWPLKRFESQKDNLFLWQLKEKTPFFILLAVFSIITIYVHDNPSMIHFPLDSRLANALVSFVTYIEKIFWPHNMTVLQLFSAQLPIWQVWGSTLLIIVISVAVLIVVKNLPYLFVGWLWYTITILPVLGIIQFGHLAMSDHHIYLPSIGITLMLSWGIPSFIKSEETRKKILFPAAIFVFVILIVLTRQQCGYWKNSIVLFSHTVQVTKDNYLAYLNRGWAYFSLGDYQLAIDDYNQAIRLNPDYTEAYYNRGIAYFNLGHYQLAIDDYNQAIRLNPDYAEAYNNRGGAYFRQGNNKLGCRDAQKACAMGKCIGLEWAKNNGYCN